LPTSGGFFDAEELTVNGKRGFLLSKNPVGMNETIRAVLQVGGQTTLLVLNDRTPDGTVRSWIWGGHGKVSGIGGTMVVSGDRPRYGATSTATESNNSTWEIVKRRFARRSPMFVRNTRW